MKGTVLYAAMAAIATLSSPNKVKAFVFTPMRCTFQQSIDKFSLLVKIPTSPTTRATAAKTAFSRPSRCATIVRASSDTDREPEVTVFDAEGGISWEEYKKRQKPDEYQMDEIDEMQCWETDECPVEDQGRFMKAWDIRSAERNPTMETHFDSEGEWEEESKGAWARKWHEDVGGDDLHHQEGRASEDDSYDI